MSLALQALQRLRRAATSGELDSVCERHAVTLLTAFGSAAQDDEDARDLDIAVAFKPDGNADPLALIDDLAAAYGPAEIDLMDLSRAGPVARKHALVDCVLLYERERGTFARTQLAAILEYMDTAWLRRIELDLLAQ